MVPKKFDYWLIEVNYSIESNGQQSSSPPLSDVGYIVFDVLQQ